MVMVYITIPALETFPQSGRLGNGALDPMKHDMRSLLARYTIREVTLVCSQTLSPPRRWANQLGRRLALVQHGDEIELASSETYACGPCIACYQTTHEPRECATPSPA